MSTTVTIKLEKVGDDKPWCAKINGLHPKYNLDREFLTPHVDYSRSNSKGTRGVYYHYHLNKGSIYEVKYKKNWNNEEQYFCIIRNGEIRKVDYSFVVEMINNAEEKT